MSGSVISFNFAHSTKILSEESIQILKLKNDHSPIKDGFRNVSNTSYMSEDSLETQAMVEIPEFLESAETFEFLEFNEATAQSLWAHYSQMAIDYPDMFDMLQCAKYHVKNSPGDAVDEEDNWLGVMENLGLTRKFQDRLMAPEAKEMRSMASVKEWTIQMITMRYEFLESLDDVIKTPSCGVDRPASRITQSGMLGGLDKNKPEIPERGSSAGKAPPKGNSESGPSFATKAIEPPMGVEDCRILYKGGASKRLESIFKAKGALDFKEIRSDPPTDFSSSTRGLYFTEQVEGAWKYAQMVARLVDGSVVPVGILQVAIPNHLLSSAYELVGQDWRRYVWACRNEEGLPPDDMAHV